MRYLTAITCLLLGLAWALLVAGAFLPLAGFIHYGSVEFRFQGWEAAGLAPFIALLSVLELMSRSPVLNDKAISIPLFLSELLFIVSPIILLKFTSGRLTVRGAYVILNLACLVLLALSLPQVVGQLDRNQGARLQLLPGLWVWFAAQMVLAVSAGVQWRSAYLIERQKFA